MPAGARRWPVPLTIVTIAALAALAAVAGAFGRADAAPEVRPAPRTAAV